MALPATDDASWQQPAAEHHGFRRFVRTLRERALLIGACGLLAVAGAALYLVTADDVYEAGADVYVSPIATNDLTLPTLGVITESVDPTLDVTTAVQLIETHTVAERTARELGLDLTPEALLEDITVEPVGQSNIISVAARRPTAEDAAEAATTFAETAVATRADTLAERIDQRLEELRRTQDTVGPDDPTAFARAEEIAELESLRAGGSLDIRVENPADIPTSRIWPRPALSLVLSLLGGLALGIAGAYAFQVLDPRLRREEQLQALYRLPILTRIPAERRAPRDRPLSWGQLSPGAVEAYRQLRASLTAPRRDGRASRVFLITGAGPSEGKTTTAVNLAAALARSGASVLLIDADLRRPAVGKAVGVESVERGIVSVLIGESTLEDAVVPVADPAWQNVHMLLADHSGPGVDELFSLPTAERLIDEAARRFDYVVVDTAPLTEVIDALPLARKADSALMVARVGRTRLGRIRELGELLAGSGIRPVGFALVAVAREERSYYYEKDGRPPTRSLRASR